MSEKVIKIGDTFSAKEDVDKYRTIYYAGASGDFNPIHIDPEFGEMVGLGGVILHGLCTFGFVAKAITDWTGDPGALKRIKCRFAKPVHLGDTITTEAKVSSIEGSKASLELKVTDQEGQEVFTMTSADVEL
ncbi:MAG: MaoC/PaaZ C-terminal domain-containing protein [Thermodesulfobacteriota bacterium]|nr:MaoC/PaaZ C-terminal domain-containing protein [Thermodesulfobacteriota bacterium]